jgi:chromosome segregation ATPase
MIDEEKTFMEIWEAIQELRASYQERHRNVQLVEQSLVTIGSNKNAEIKKMRNSIEEMKELVSKNGLDGDEKVEKDDTETIEKDHITSQENVENEGETPSAGTNDTPPTTENGEGGEAPSTENGDGTSPSVEPNGETSENGEQPLEENAVALKATILDLQAKLKVVEDSNEQLKNEKAELEAKLNYQNSKVKVTKTDLKENTTAPTEEDINLARQGVRKLFRRV